LLRRLPRQWLRGRRLKGWLLQAWLRQRGLGRLLQLLRGP
jgi:hypothetical protein